MSSSAIRLGKLQYRGQLREHRYLPDADYVQPCQQINNPQLENGPHIRTIEWKHMMPRAGGRARPGNRPHHRANHYAIRPRWLRIPVPRCREQGALSRPMRRRRRRFQTFSSAADWASISYYDMDQAIARARMLARKILDQPAGKSPSLLSSAVQRVVG